MEDQDPTLKLPKHTTPPVEGLTDSQMQNLMAAGAGAFATQQPTRPTRNWQPPTLEQLQQTLPQYEITAFIARGGMGAVYRGTQKTLKRPVAIKVLPPEMEQGDMQFAARFKHEAQAMAQLSHPNIVAVFEAGEVDGMLYFVMEFIEGTDVAQLIASEGRIEPQRAIQITSAVCEALAFAHEEGIIHRDIKPSNIMIDKRGRVKVADFGLAKTVNVEHTLLTGSNVAMGTPDFIAPEAMMPGLKMDGRADLYAVGVMLYQMLTGTIPRGRFGLPSSVIPQMDKGFDTIVDKAMQTDRENRYSTATEMKRALEEASRSKRVAVSVPAPVATKPGTSRAPLLFGISVGAVILATGTFVVLKQPPATGPGQAISEATPKSITALPRPAEFRPTQTVFQAKKIPAPFSLKQWHQLFPVEKPDVWERLSSHEDGLLYVKATVGFKRPMPSTADGAIRAVVRIKTENDNPMLIGRFSDQRGYYQALWDVKSSMVGLSYYGFGSQKEYKVLGAKVLPKEMTLRVGDVLRLELRLEGDHIIAITNGTFVLDFHHDKLKAAGDWGIKSLNGAWFESAEMEPIPSP